MENIHNINFVPVKSVVQWDTKRVKAYMIRIQKHISYLENETYFHQTDSKEEREKIIEKFKNYKKELKRILNGRENIK